MTSRSPKASAVGEDEGKLIDRAGWEIYISEFDRLARAFEEKVRKLSEALPKGWQESIFWAKGKANRVVLCLSSQNDGIRRRHPHESRVPEEW